MKRIIVTGAAGGIGKAIVKKLTSKDNLVICVDANAKALKSMDELFDSSNLVKIHSDLSSIDLCESLVQYAGDTGFSGLIHAAGTLETDLNWGEDPNLFGRVVNSNLKNAYDLTGVFFKNLDKNSKISIVYFSSVSYRRGAYENIAYSIAKAGIVGLTRSVAKRLGPRGVVNAIAPGVILANTLDNMPAEYVSGHADRLLGNIPMKRFGRPEEVAELVNFLVSDVCTYMTGQVLNIDGGSHNS